MNSVNIAALVLRLAVGGTVIAHGWNHAFGGGKLPGTARWFESIGIRPGRVHALAATVTELGAGALLVLGLLTPLAAAGVVGTMLVALVANHARNGFFIFRPGEGYEYVLMITLVSCAIGALGGGAWSLDHAAGFSVRGWAGLAVAALAGAGGAGLLLATSWRPAPVSGSEVAETVKTLFYLASGCLGRRTDMTSLEHGLFDCDTHCYETRDSFTRYLPNEWKQYAIAPVRLPDGTERILAADRIAVFNSEQGLGFDLAYRPGSLKEMLRQMASGNPDETYLPEPMRPEYTDRETRLKLMEAQGVERAVVFPSAMALSVENYVKHVPAAYANIHSFNQWFDEEWGFSRGGKIFAPALLSLADRDLAVKELDFVLGRGARIILLPTGPAYGRSPGDPYFDAVWARMNEAGVTVAFHIMENWYNENVAGAWGHNPWPGSWHMSAWQWNNLYGERPIEDTLSALIFDNLFGRFGNLNVLVAEFGASWVPHFTEHMDKSRGMGRNGPWIGGKLTERPSRIFRRHVRVVPYPEDDIPRIARDLPDVDCLVMGSDFPHAEGLAEPAEFAGLLDGLTGPQQRQVLRDNAAKLFGTD